MLRGSVVLFTSAVVAACGHSPGTAPEVHDAPVIADAAEPIDAPVDAPADAPTDSFQPAIAPDLQFVAAEMTSAFYDRQVFRDDDCAVVEGCVGAPGARNVLRFATVTTNRGTADLSIGMTPPPGESNATFEWSPCHMHHHFRNYTTYELTNTTGVVVRGRKQSFCLSDSEQVMPGFPSNAYSCTNQGLTRGWADVYDNTLPCQWIDVTGVPSGNYTLRITVNPAHSIVESDYSNNVFTLPVTF